MKKSYLLLFLFTLIFCVCGQKKSPTGASDEPNELPVVNKIAFNCLPATLDENYALAVIDPDSSNITKIGYNMQSMRTGFSWSPDASLLVFLNEASISTDENSNMLGYEICVANSDGTETNNLNEFGIAARISPDNKLIAYIQLNANGEINHYNLKIMNVDGTNPRTIQENVSGVSKWSDDSESIVYIIQTGNLDEWEFYTINIDSGVSVPTADPYPTYTISLDQFQRDTLEINDTEMTFSSTQISPDYTKGIAVFAFRSSFPFSKIEGYMTLYDFVEKEETVLVEKMASLSYFSWSPDSKKIVFTHSTGIDIMDVENKVRRRLITFAVSNISNYIFLVWSPR